MNKLLFKALLVGSIISLSEGAHLEPWHDFNLNK